MKDTLRKTKSARAGSGSEVDGTSNLDATTQSSDSASVNPWASEASDVNGDTLSRQVSKSISPVQTATMATKERSQSPQSLTQTLSVPDEHGSEDPASKPNRRRKTITKNPHTFELEADLIPAKSKGQPSPAAPTAPTAEAPPVATTKKKKRVSQAPPVENATPTTAAAGSVVVPPSKPPVSTSPQPTSANNPPATPTQTTSPSVMISPASPKQTTSSTVTPVNPFSTNRTKKSQSLSGSTIPQIVANSNPCRFTPPPLPQESFHGKVIVISNGASLVGQAMIRHFHSAGCRVIFGDTNTDQARKLISALGPPHVVHYNKCDMTRYADMLELFKLAVTMYGRVDHAIFGVNDDGGQTCTVGEGEKGWFSDRTGVNKTARMAYSEVETEPTGLGNILTASIRFAQIAMAYLKYSPKSKATKKATVNPYSKPQPEAPPAPGKDDRSLTFITSISALKETPLLPIYQITQHSILGLVRSLRTSVNPDPERDGVRVNAVATNIMVPRAVSQAGGRSMSVQLPPDRPEDVARVVVGVVATNSSTPDVDGGNAPRGGIWYEKGFERGMREKHLHGRVLYSVGAECWDVQEGLDRSEAVWMGNRPAEAVARGLTGINGRGDESTWILDMP